MSSKKPEELSKKKSKRRKHRENGFEEWGGYMAAKKQKLEMQFEDKKALELMDQKETKIFNGIGIFVNGLTTPSADELKRLMLIHGGKYYHYPTSKITHVIASNLPKSKMKQVKTQVIVRGDWITDSIRAGKLLPHQNYFLYSPEVADKQQRLQIGNYFQKKSKSSPVTEIVKEDYLPRKQNQKTSMLEELFGEDLDSNSSIDSEQNILCHLVNNSNHKKSSSTASYQKHSTSNHTKMSSPVKSSFEGSSSIAVSTQNQKISSNDSSHLKISNHTFNECNFSKMNDMNEAIIDELFEETLESNSNIVYEQNIKSSSVNKNSCHQKSSANVSYQKHSKSNHNRVSSPVKSSSNVAIPVSKFTSSYSKFSLTKSSPNLVSPVKSSSNVSVSAQNHNIHCEDSSHTKPSLKIPQNHTFNGSSLSKKKNESKFMLNELFGEDLDSDSSIDSEQSTKNITVNKNSHKKISPNVSYQKHSTSHHGKVSSPMKSSNVDISASTQNQNFTNKDSSYLKSDLVHKNVKNIPVNQRTSNKDSLYSKPSKSGDSSISPQKHGQSVKAGDPNFLPEFFNHSRKHHISTSAQELKRYVQFLVENNKKNHFPKRDRLRELSQQFPNDSSFISSDPKTKGRQRVIMHLDMDCFFVSVGLKKHPELRGLPVAVTHSKGKRGGPQEGSDIHYEVSHYANESKKKLQGVISGNEISKSSNQSPKVSIYSEEYGSLSEVACCSYEARQAGVRNGLFLGEALRRCPNLQTIPYDFEGYSEVSKQLYDIVASYTLDIEAVSCDELYVDCTKLLQDVHLSPHQFASVLRAEIETETGCTASAGIGSNMLLARLATKTAKPNGQHYVHDADVENFMKKHKVEDLPGVGYTTAKKLLSINIRTCDDLQSWSLSKLQQKFGAKIGQAFYNSCRGKDDRVVQYHKERKSVSAEVNYGIRFETDKDVYNFINQLSVEVQNRIQNLNCKGKLVTLKLMVRKRDAPVETAKFMGHGVCDNLSHSISLKSATDSSQVISKECCGIAHSLKIKPQDYRGVGIQISKLEPAHKDNKAGGNVFKQSNKESASEMDSSYGIFAPKNLEKVNKVIPEKSTITHFLSNKSSPSKPLENTAANNLVKNSSPIKQFEPSSKHRQKTKTIQHFLSNKPSTSRTMPYNVADYLPGEIDQSVLEALPDNLKKEILESCKSKSAEKGRNSLNQSASTSSANEQNESAKSLCQKQNNEDIGVRMDSNSLGPELIGLDQSFLNALPDDLKKEVLDSYDSVSNKRHKNSTMTSTVQQPSTSFASTSNNQLKLDESVLNALPEDLKKEVLHSYGEHPSSKTYKLHQPSTSNQVCSSNEYVSTEQKSLKKTPENDSDEQPLKKKPTLAGAFELDDVRALIKEWIDSTDDPLEEDINNVKTFLVELCDVDLCKVEILSKYLYRMAKKANQKWKDVYLTVLSSVQEKVMSIYQCTLILNSEFS